MAMFTQGGAAPIFAGRHSLFDPTTNAQDHAVILLSTLVSLLHLLGDEEGGTQAIFRTLDHWGLASIFNLLEGMAREYLVAVRGALSVDRCIAL